MNATSTKDSKANRRLQFIRAEAKDVVFIARLLREFYAKEGSHYRIKFDYESCLATVDDVVTRGVSLVGPTSCAGAMLIPFPWNNNATVAHVVFWYFRNAREMAIFDALRSACIEHGATHIAAYGQMPHARVNRFYEKKGLRNVELAAIGEIKYGKLD